jgi:UDP-4-amino-4,6-dideoxy-N-acetyl-beta-L-altrosamine transaminase
VINYGRHSIFEEDIQEVVNVLKSSNLTQGTMVPKFEESLLKWTGARYAVATNSATSALHIACIAMGLSNDDWLWTSAITFVASANCAVYCGAKVDFVDIDPLTYNISVECLSDKLRQAEKDGRLPKIVVCVHMCGQSCDMRKIRNLSEKYGFRIIEDASHALGGSYCGERIGSSIWSDITVFSFHPVKMITTGEGGAAITNEPELARSMQLTRSHGITNMASEMANRNQHQIWNYQQIQLGYNYRLSDIHAALGVSQMLRLESFLKARKKIAKEYDRVLSTFPIKTPWQHPDVDSSYHLYPIRLLSGATTKSQKKVYAELHAVGIFVNLHYIPVYRHPFYAQLGFEEGYCEEAERYFNEALTLPIYPGLTDQQQGYVMDKLGEILMS